MSERPGGTAVLDPAANPNALNQGVVTDPNLVIVDPNTGHEYTTDGPVGELPQTQVEVDPNDPKNWDEAELKRRLQLQVVDVSDGVTANARDKAEAYINEQTNDSSGNFASRFIKKIFIGNLARDAVRARQTSKARKQILETDNMYAAQGHNKTADDEAKEMIVGRFAQDYANSQVQPGETVLNHAAGETNDFLVNTESGKVLDGELRDLIKRYASGSVTEANLAEEKKQILSRFGQTVSGADRNKGLMYADNITEVAKNAKLAVEHNIGLEAVDAALNAMHGDARVGVRSQAKLNGAERFAESASKYFVNETVFMTGASIALTAAAISTKSAALATGIFGGTAVVAGAWAGAREAGQIKRDRSTHARQMAEGGGDLMIQGGKRRERIDETRYNTVSATELSNALRDAQANIGNDAAGLNAAIEAVVHARARTNISDKEGIDLISFTDKVSVEKERWVLNLDIAETRLAIDKILQSQDPADKARLTEAGIATTDLEDLLKTRSAQVDELLKNDATAKDEAFAKLRRTEIRNKALMAAGTSLLVGGLIQEAGAQIEDLDGTNDRQGLFEGRDVNQNQETLSERFKDNLVSWWNGGPAEAVPTTGGTMESVTLGENLNANINVPNGLTVSQNGNVISFVDGSGNQVGESFTLDPNEPLQDTQARLQSEDYTVDIDRDIVDANGEVVVVGAVIPAQEYIQQYPDSFTHVSRSGWYDNDSAAFDRNELGLRWGGVDGSGIDENGNYVLTLDGFEDDGSWHGDERADYREMLASDEIKLEVSASKETQAEALGISFNENGQAIIDPDSEVGQLFATEDGQADFNGGYAEVAEMGELRADGTQVIRPMATLVGDNSFEGFTPPTHEETTITITPPAYSDLDVGIPIAAPLYGRRGLEDPANPEEPIADVPPAVPINLRRTPEDQPPTPGGVLERRPDYPVDIPEAGGQLEPRPQNPIAQNETVEGEVVSDEPLMPINGGPGIVDGEVVPTSPPRAIGPEQIALDAAPVSPEQVALEAARRAELEANRPLAAIETAAAQNLPALYNGGRNFANPTSLLANPRALETAEAQPRSSRNVVNERSAMSTYLYDQQGTPIGGAIERVANSLPPMADNNRLSINIATDMDDASLLRRLEDYASQRDADGNPVPYEVNVLRYQSSGAPASSNATLVTDFVNRYEQENGFRPPINAVVVDLDSVGEGANGDKLFVARKLLADATLRRRLNNPRQSEPLYIEADDADYGSTDPQLAAKLIERLDANPRVDAIRSGEGRTPEFVKNNDLLLLQQQSRAFLNILTSRNQGMGTQLPNWNETAVTGGWNAAYSAEAYARAQGFDSSVRDALRASQQVGPISEANQATYSDALSGYIREINGRTTNQAEAEAVTKRLFHWLGLKDGEYQIQPDGNVAVQDWSGVKAKLTGLRRRTQGSGNLFAAQAQAPVTLSQRALMAAGRGPSRRPSHL